MNFNWFEKAKIMIFGQNQQNSKYFEISLQGIFSENNEAIQKDLPKAKCLDCFVPRSDAKRVYDISVSQQSAKLSRQP